MLGCHRLEMLPCTLSCQKSHLLVIFKLSGVVSLQLLFSLYALQAFDPFQVMHSF